MNRGKDRRKKWGEGKKRERKGSREKDSRKIRERN